MSDLRNAIPNEYNSLKAGSIDGTDDEPHDRAIVRAMNVSMHTPVFHCGTILTISFDQHYVRDHSLFHPVLLFISIN